MQEYPKWIAVDGPGHPGNPGKVLVENEQQEAEANRTGSGPDHLNPPYDERRADAVAAAPVAEILQDGLATKSIDEQNRAEMTATLATILMRSLLTDDEIRDQVRSLQDWLSARDAEALHDAEESDLSTLATTAEPLDPSESGGPGRDEKAADPEPITDVAGEKAPPPANQEANAAALDPGERTAPLPKVDQATDARPDEAKEREAADKPATDQLAQAETPADEKEPPEEGGKPGKSKASAPKK